MRRMTVQYIVLIELVLITMVLVSRLRKKDREIRILPEKTTVMKSGIMPTQSICMHH